MPAGELVGTDQMRYDGQLWTIYQLEIVPLAADPNYFRAGQGMNGQMRVLLRLVNGNTRVQLTGYLEETYRGT